MNTTQKFSITQNNGEDPVYVQSRLFEVYICKQLTRYENIDLENLADHCEEKQIDLKNCGCLGLRVAFSGNETLTNHIFEQVKGDLEISYLGATPLLSLMAEAMPDSMPAIFPLIKKLIEANANVNKVMDKTSHALWCKELPDYATPLYMAIEKHKHILTAMFLLRYRAIAHPILSAEGKKLLVKCQWLENSGKLLFMCLYAKEFVFKDFNLGIDLNDLITRLTFTLD